MMELAKYERVLVGVDLTAIDSALIRYAAFWGKLTGARKIYFVHVERELYWPTQAGNDLPNTGKPMDELLLQTMQAQVAEHFGSNSDIETVCEVIEGAPFAQMVHWAEVKNVDLVIVGKKHKLKGSGIMPDKLARTLRRPLLFVPEKAEARLQKILVPIDFSEYAEMAFAKSVALAKLQQSAEVVAQHVYEVPMGYYKSGLSHGEFKNKMLKFAENRFELLVQRWGREQTPIRALYTFDEEEDVAAHICRSAKAEEVDLVVIGAKGHSALTVFLLGSTTEKMLRIQMDVPVLLIKKPNQELNFLDTLLLN